MHRFCSWNGKYLAFPYIVSDWGGMTFLLPYLMFVILIASTGVIEEMALGRAAKSGPIKAFGMCTGFAPERNGPVN